MKKRFYSFLLAVAFVLAMVPATPVAEAATDHSDHSDGWTALPEETDQALDAGNKYYCVESDTTLTGPITVTGNVTICLNGQTLNITPGDSAGIKVESGTLTLSNCQDNGSLNVTGENSNAITLQGASSQLILSGNFSIKGGTAGIYLGTDADVTNGCITVKDYTISEEKKITVACNGAWAAGDVIAKEATEEDVSKFELVNNDDFVLGLKGTNLKVLGKPTCTEPVANSLTYTGAAQGLITAGNATGGQMQYALGSDSETQPESGKWQDAIPTGIDAKDYYVWYKVVGDDNHVDSEPQLVTVTINKAKGSLTAPTALDRTYDGTESELVNNGTVTGGTMKYSLTEGEYSDEIPKGTTAGTYTVYWEVTPDEDNYDFESISLQGSVPVTISKANPNVTEPTAKTDLTYNGTEQQLLDSGATSVPEGATIKYYVGAKNDETQPDDDIDWKENYNDIKATDAGTYYVWYKVEGNDNINGTEAKYITVTIAPAAASGDVPTAKELTYNGDEQQLLTQGSVTGGTMMYYVGDINPGTGAGVWTKDASSVKGTNAGTYTIWYYVKGDDNHSDTEPVSISVTIAKAPVSFTVTDSTHTYDTNPYTATVTQKDDEIQIPDGGFTVTYGEDGAQNKTDVGTYDIKVTLNNDNFKFKDQDETTRNITLEEELTISAADLTLTVNPVTITYGTKLEDKLLSGQATISGGTEITGTWAWDTGDSGKYPAVSDSEETKYTVKFTPEDKSVSNFKSLTTSITITVNKAKLTPSINTVENIEQFNNTTATAGTIKLTGAVRDESPTASGVFNFDTSTAGENKTVTVTGIKLENNWGDNYELTTTELNNQNTTASIGKRVAVLQWKMNDGDTFTADYTGKPVAVTAAVTNQVDGYPCTVTVTDGGKTNAGTYTATAKLSDEANYTLPSDGTQQKGYTITPAEVSFEIKEEIKANWADKGETNADPNEKGYTIGAGNALTMTYDSYSHTVNVAQKESESVRIGNGFTVTYRKDGTGDDLTSIRDAGTYDIVVNIRPAEGEVYNFKFSGQDAAAHSLKIGTVTVEQYPVTVLWSHLSYVYHGHPMHPVAKVQNPFAKDNIQTESGLPEGFDTANPDGYTGKYLVAFGETENADVGQHPVTVKLFGQNAGNYTVTDAENTVTIVAAPVTFTVGDNIWVLTDGQTSSRDVTLRPAWGEVTAEPDKDEGTDHQYPAAGSAIEKAEFDLETTIEYRKDGETYSAPDYPSEPGTYEVYVMIGNPNFRHSATNNGGFHLVGELVITDDESSVTFYSVTFEPGYTLGAGKSAPAKMEKVLPGQTVVLPAVSGANPDGSAYDLSRNGGWKLTGWSYGGITYLPNEEFHMPDSDVTFTAQWEQSHKVAGKVMQGDDIDTAAALPNADVVLKQGAETVKETVTDSNGNFSFENLTSGIYNLEITYNSGSARIVKTFMVDIESDDSLDGVYLLPSGALNTVVQVTDPDITVAVDLGGITADSAVYTEEDKKTVKDGGTVEFKMEVAEKNVTDSDIEEQIGQIPVSEEQIGMVLDLTLTKTVTNPGAGSGNETPIFDSKALVTTVIHLPAELQGKDSYTVYRFHNAGDGNQMQTITTSPNADREYLEVIRDGTAIEIHARLYSVYVLTWAQIPVSSSYRVALPAETPHGTVTASRTYATRGTKVTVTVKPDEGYHLGSLTVTDRNGKPLELTDNGDGAYTFTMPSGRVDAKAEFVKCGSLDFTDLDTGAWYHAYTDYVIANSLMQGIGGAEFDPAGTTTRGAIMTVLARRAGADTAGGEPWYQPGMDWAVENKISDGTAPEREITRAELVTMLYRFAESPEVSAEALTGYTDSADVPDWAADAMAWAVTNGIIEGRSDGSTTTLSPTATATRAEAAKIIAVFCGKSGK